MIVKSTTSGIMILSAALLAVSMGNAGANTDADVAAVTAANNAFYAAMSALDAK